MDALFEKYISILTKMVDGKLDKEKLVDIIDGAMDSFSKFIDDDAFWDKRADKRREFSDPSHLYRSDTSSSEAHKMRLRDDVERTVFGGAMNAGINDGLSVEESARRADLAIEALRQRS